MQHAVVFNHRTPLITERSNTKDKNRSDVTDQVAIKLSASRRIAALNHTALPL